MTNTDPLRLLALTAHPDDETLGFGATLARYAAEGVETHVLCSTRGERGRYGDNSERPGDDVLGEIRELELRAAAAALGVRDVRVLNYLDAELDRAPASQIIDEIAEHIRRIRPQVILTFDPEGAYGHPDHIAICQFGTAAIIAAADPSSAIDGDPHGVSKLYYLAWSSRTWDAYQAAFKRLVATVDEVEREAAPWPDWAITTLIEAEAYVPQVWRAVQCHTSQMGQYAALAQLSDEQKIAAWGRQEYYRAFSRVNGGRAREDDLFEGLR